MSRWGKLIKLYGRPKGHRGFDHISSQCPSIVCHTNKQTNSAHRHQESLTSFSVALSFNKSVYFSHMCIYTQFRFGRFWSVFICLSIRCGTRLPTWSQSAIDEMVGYTSLFRLGITDRWGVCDTWSPLSQLDLWMYSLLHVSFFYMHSCFVILEDLSQISK